LPTLFEVGCGDKTVKLTLAATLLAVLFPAIVAAQQRLPGSYPLTLTRGSRLLVAAEINGHAVEALLDSAAEATFIDSALASELRLASDATVTGQGSGGKSFDARLIRGMQLRAFGITLSDQTVATADLQDVGQRLLGRKLEMILGREIFDAARLQIDILGQRVTVLAADTAPPGVRLQLHREHGVETIPVRIEGHGPVRATFDLGNGSEVLVGRGLAAKLRLLSDGRSVRTESGGGLGGEITRQVVTLRSLEVGGSIFRDVSAAVDTQPSASDLNVGVSILKNFLITTDFSAHTVWLERRP